MINDCKMQGRTWGAGSYSWFPGRWLGGLSLLIAPLVLLTGVCLRLPYPYFFPDQLAAFASARQRLSTAYACVAAGNILLWPGILLLVQLIGRRERVLAVWAGVCVLMGLFARSFHAGADHLAAGLVAAGSVSLATRAVAASYGQFSIVSTLNGMIMAGWVLLAVGAYRAKILGSVRAIALGSMSALMLGVLKGSSSVSVMAIGGLCVALMPLGVSVLSAGSAPGRRQTVGWALGIIVLLTILYWFGQAG